jgi:hypothetical protein
LQVYKNGYYIDPALEELTVEEGGNRLALNSLYYFRAYIKTKRELK